MVDVLCQLALLFTITFPRFPMFLWVLGHSFWLPYSIPLREYTQISYPVPPSFTSGGFLSFASISNTLVILLCTQMRSGSGISKWFGVPGVSITGDCQIGLRSSWTTRIIPGFPSRQSIIVVVLLFANLCEIVSYFIDYIWDDVPFDLLMGCLSFFSGGEFFYSQLLHGFLLFYWHMNSFSIWDWFFWPVCMVNLFWSL